MSSKRPPRAASGELKAKWGKSREHGPDLHYALGEGVPRADARMLHNFLSEMRWPGPLSVSSHLGEGKSLLSLPHEPCFLDELVARGYDLETLEIRVRKKSHESSQ